MGGAAAARWGQAHPCWAAGYAGQTGLGPTSSAPGSRSWRPCVLHASRPHAPSPRPWHPARAPRPSPQGISDAYKHIIRSFLVHFHANIMRHSTKRFDYRGGSVGNFFFAGARIFFR